MEQHLNTIASGLRSMQELLDRMSEHCDPYIYYQRVRVPMWVVDPTQQHQLRGHIMPVLSSHASCNGSQLGVHYSVSLNFHNVVTNLLNLFHFKKSISPQNTPCLGHISWWYLCMCRVALHTHNAIEPVATMPAGKAAIFLRTLMK